jgi:hypothetical protein
MAEDNEALKGSKYNWLYNAANITRRQKHRFKALRDSTLKAVRAWAIKIRSRGFRNKQRFANAIYFHLGGLDLYTEAISR